MLQLDILHQHLIDHIHLDGPADIHSVNNCFTEPAISLHVYAKPYDSCEIYDIKTKQINRLQMKYHSINGQIC